MSMKKLLITGAGPNGITGRLAKQYFEDRYEVLTPSSVELDLTDSTQVSEYFRRNKIDYVLHCATFRNKISNQCTFANTLLNSNLRMSLWADSMPSIPKRFDEISLCQSIVSISLFQN